MDFPYLRSIDELEDFSDFVKNLKVKKIQGALSCIFVFRLMHLLIPCYEDWWDHKFTSKWIIPCILQSQSKIDPGDLRNLPATTNIGEGQHHWANHQSGIKLPLVEAIVS